MLKIELYCLDCVGKTGRVQQAQFLARVLLDKNLLVRGDELPRSGDGALINKQTQLQRRLEEMAYTLLGQAVPPEHGFLTQDEATALATKLNAVN